MTEEFKQFVRQRAELEDIWILPAPLSKGRSSPEPEVPANVREKQLNQEKPVPTMKDTQIELPVFADGEEKYLALSRYESLAQLDKGICDCTRCELGKTRTKFVFGVGSHQAELVFIGEAPGKDEDEQGIPFVGRAGKLLTEMLGQAGLSRDEVYICNVLKCRPPENRDPLPNEVATCEGYLHRQLELLKPKLLVALGRIAGQTLLNVPNASSAKLRSQEHIYRGIPLMVTYHPAYILRDMNRKWEGIADLAKIKDRLISLGGTRGIN